jgi:glutamate-1-semialdehyde 2,1-aminomutase
MSKLQLEMSRKAYEHMKDVLPRGVSGWARYLEPSPIHISRGKGSRFVHLDGNEYVDYQMGFGALILGYGNP